MADRIVGNPPNITVSGDIISWPVSEFDQAIFDAFTLSDFVIKTNGTRSTSQITAIGGLQGDNTYQITVTTGHGFITSDRCTPQVGNTINTYSTIVAAWIAATTDGSDTLRLWFVDTNGTTYWREALTGVGATATTDVVSVIGMLPHQRVKMGATAGTANFGIGYNGDLSGVTSPFTISNLTFSSGVRRGVRILDTTGTHADCIIERCVFLGQVDGILYNGKTNGAIIRNNIIISPSGLAGIHIGTGTAKVLGNTVIGCFVGIQNLSLANLIQNNICIANGTDFPNKTNGTFVTNFSSDSTGDTTGKFEPDIGFVGEDGANGQFPLDYRVTTTAAVLAQGTTHADLTNDISGNARPGTPAVGASEGIFYGATPDFPDRENVRDNDTVNLLVGLYERALEPDVRLATTYGANGTEFTGELIPSGTVPGNPILSNAIAGDGQVTLTFAAADPADVIFARFRQVGAGHTGAWAAESGVFSRTGSGIIIVTGLPNSTQHEFSGYARDGGLTSDWTPPLLATPTDGTPELPVTNIMDAGAVWFADKMFTHASTSATYSRGNDSVILDVVRAETAAELNDEFGINIDVRVADFIIRQDDLIIASVLVKPERGDTIEIVIGAETITYDVLSQITEDIYRESDRFGNTYRVHTKESGRT